MPCILPSLVAHHFLVCFVPGHFLSHQIVVMNGGGICMEALTLAICDPGGRVTKLVCVAVGNLGTELGVACLEGDTLVISWEAIPHPLL